MVKVFLFQLFAGEQVLAPDVEPVQIASADGDVLLVALKDGRIQAFDIHPDRQAQAHAQAQAQGQAFATEQSQDDDDLSTATPTTAAAAAAANAAAAAAANAANAAGSGSGSSRQTRAGSNAAEPNNPNNDAASASGAAGPPRAPLVAIEFWTVSPRILKLLYVAALDAVLTVELTTTEVLAPAPPSARASATSVTTYTIEARLYTGWRDGIHPLKHHTTNASNVMSEGEGAAQHANQPVQGYESFPDVRTLASSTFTTTTPTTSGTTGSTPATTSASLASTTMSSSTFNTSSSVGGLGASSIAGSVANPASAIAASVQSVMRAIATCSTMGHVAIAAGSTISVFAAIPADTVPMDSAEYAALPQHQPRARSHSRGSRAAAPSLLRGLARPPRLLHVLTIESRWTISSLAISGDTLAYASNAEVKVLRLDLERRRVQSIPASAALPSAAPPSLPFGSSGVSKSASHLSLDSTGSSAAPGGQPPTTSSAPTPLAPLLAMSLALESAETTAPTAPIVDVHYSQCDFDASGTAQQRHQVMLLPSTGDSSGSSPSSSSSSSPNSPAASVVLANAGFTRGPRLDTFEHLGPRVISDHGVTVVPSATTLGFVLRQCVLLLHKRFSADARLHSLALLPEYGRSMSGTSASISSTNPASGLVLGNASPLSAKTAGRSPQVGAVAHGHGTVSTLISASALADDSIAGLRCFISEARQGHLFDLAQPGLICAYSYTSNVSRVHISSLFLHAIAETGLETYTLRSSWVRHREPTVPDVCLLGLNPFIGLRAVVSTDHSVVVLSKMNTGSSRLEAEKHSRSSRASIAPTGAPRATRDCSWNVYILHMTKLPELYTEMTTSASSYLQSNARFYHQLLLEGFLLLQAGASLRFRRPQTTSTTRPFCILGRHGSFDSLDSLDVTPQPAVVVGSSRSRSSSSAAHSQLAPPSDATADNNTMVQLDALLRAAAALLGKYFTDLINPDYLRGARYYAMSEVPMSHILRLMLPELASSTGEQDYFVDAGSQQALAAVEYFNHVLLSTASEGVSLVAGAAGTGANSRLSHAQLMERFPIVASLLARLASSSSVQSDMESASLGNRILCIYRHAAPTLLSRLLLDSRLHSLCRFSPTYALRLLEDVIARRAQHVPLSALTSSQGASQGQQASQAHQQPVIIQNYMALTRQDTFAVASLHLALGRWEPARKTLMSLDREYLITMLVARPELLWQPICAPAVSSSAARRKSTSAASAGSAAEPTASAAATIDDNPLTYIASVVRHPSVELSMALSQQRETVALGHLLRRELPNTLLETLLRLGTRISLADALAMLRTYVSLDHAGKAIPRLLATSAVPQHPVLLDCDDVETRQLVMSYLEAMLPTILASTSLPLYLSPESDADLTGPPPIGSALDVSLPYFMTLLYLYLEQLSAAIARSHQPNKPLEQQTALEQLHPIMPQQDAQNAVWDVESLVTKTLTLMTHRQITPNVARALLALVRHHSIPTWQRAEGAADLKGNTMLTGISSLSLRGRLQFDLLCLPLVGQLDVAVSHVIRFCPSFLTDYLKLFATDLSDWQHALERMLAAISAIAASFGSDSPTDDALSAGSNRQQQGKQQPADTSGNLPAETHLEAANLCDSELHRAVLVTSYFSMLEHLSATLEPGKFLPLLPAHGSMQVFLPYIMRCFQAFSASALKQTMARSALDLS
ncbi:hypothetical protein CAOG_01555 [Capsaspora owczarzaki ATCC 30864]|uniref:hypothetical protein n=1 Tax=Capsaspora owczarzaki (strain ATCC 30864) TaxID=595528 RepID=UPI00035221F8|nr:hypothetical protein CAOG_01555 [Capsaspora owczarzaki ATCC 30864]|eukprot:XP_004364423.2 hypothetical protein CAOG_01555 [Capsaspora owczarzaki ATCC 30864]